MIIYFIMNNRFSEAVSEKQAFIPNHMITAQTLDNAQLDASNEATLLATEADSVGAMHHKLSVDIYTQMSHHKALQKHGDEKY